MSIDHSPTMERRPSGTRSIEQRKEFSPGQVHQRNAGLARGDKFQPTALPEVETLNRNLHISHNFEQYDELIQALLFRKW